MAAPTVTAVTGPFSVASGNYTVTLPAHTTDDIIVICVQNATNGALVFNQNTAGFAEILRSGNTSRCTLAYWVRATSSSMTNPVITGQTNHALACALTINGCITTGNPWDVTASNDISTATASWTWTGVTTTVADTLCLFVGGSTRDNTGAWMGDLSNSNLTGIAEQFDNSITNNNGGGLVASVGTSASAQAIGTTSGTAVASYTGNTLTISFIPPGGGGGGVTNAGRNALLGVGK